MADEEEIADDDSPFEYPLQLGLFYLFLVGYFARSIFVSLKLPASVGVMASGFAFSYFLQEDLRSCRDELQELAFFLVLLTAGLDIALSDLKGHVFVCALLPGTLEMLAIAGFGVLVLHFTLVESLVMGTTLFALGDGLVIPKMKEFQCFFEKHPLPHLVFVCVPIEASLALVLFGVLGGFASPANAPKEVNIPMVILGNVLRIVATIAVGSFLGWTSGRFSEARTKFAVWGRYFFTGKPVETFLILVSTAFLGFGLGSGKPGKEVVPIRISEGSLFQPELMVIVVGAVFSDTVGDHTLHEVEEVLGGVWVFGQIVLFTMLGSKTSLTILPKIPHVLPVILVGLTFRLLGVALALVLTVNARPPHSPDTQCIESKWKYILPNILFCFLGTVPRATLQGALGSIPLQARFFQEDSNRHHVEEFISCSAKIYIVLLAVAGMVLLNTFGPMLLELDYESMKAAPQEVPNGEIQSPDKVPALVAHAQSDPSPHDGRRLQQIRPSGHVTYYKRQTSWAKHQFEA